MNLMLMGFDRKGGINPEYLNTQDIRCLKKTSFIKTEEQFVILKINKLVFEMLTFFQPL
jgi:hypothetical protein